MYRVIDKITFEVLEFDNQMDAEMVADRRLSMHKKGYKIGRSMMHPCEAKLIIKGKDYIICEC